jgi:amidase
MSSHRGWHGYCSIANLLDYPACAFPVTTVDAELDVPDTEHEPLNEFDESHAAQCARPVLDLRMR